MNKKYNNIVYARKRDWMQISGLVMLLGLMLMVFEVRAQEGSQGNTTIFGGAEMTFFGNHNFLAPAGGAQPGVILTERATATISYLNFFGNGLTSTGADDANYVDGYVRKYGTGQFIFPVGDNGNVGQFAASADGTNGAYFHADASVAITNDLFTGANYPVLPAGGLPAFPRTSKQTSIGNIDAVEYWDINGANATPITLTWDAGSNVAALTSSTLSKLVIVGWDATASRWVKIPATVDVTSILGGASSLTAGSITTTASIVPDTYSIYTLAAAVPDLTPTLRITPAQIVGNNKPINVRVVVAEINGVQTSGNIFVTIPVSSHYTVNTYNSAQTTSTGLPVQNTQWAYLGISGSNHVFRYGGTAGVTTLAASGSSAFGFSLAYSANTQSGTENIVVSIFDGSGGELNFLNNKDNENINFSY
ncbi:hypothetical protein [Dyadobacter diqingensis]|uniref:hypothetical protein n=1 Tax=Dyadobacter diqingensis TaxID=2938121 RepID=UPI0020C193EB|nr:hypothetical protein [Dyadobacter diqingensis]